MDHFHPEKKKTAVKSIRILATYLVLLILFFFILCVLIISQSFNDYCRDDIEDEQYLFEGVKLTEAEYSELR